MTDAVNISDEIALAEREWCARILDWLADRSEREADEQLPARATVMRDAAEVIRACALHIRNGRQDVREAIQKGRDR